MRESTGSRAALVAFVLLATLAALEPASAKTIARPAVSNSERLQDIKSQGNKAQRLAEARQRLWDRKMKAVSGSICTGC